MKINKILGCLITLSLLLFSGCGTSKKSSYPFLYDTAEISQIRIVYTLKDFYNDNSCFEVKTEITDKESFLNNFNQIQFGKYIIGDPTHISEDMYAVLVNYNNGDYEFINYYAQEIIISERIRFGKAHCDKEEFDNFINQYLSVE